MRDNINYKKQVVENALREYNISIYSTDNQRKLDDAINMLENVYMMCAPFNVEGISTIKEILSKEKTN